MAAATGTRRNLLPWRLATQIVFILIHVLLIRAVIPNLVWAMYGILFWGILVYLTARTGRWVCGWICWLGGAQDLLARWAKPRIAFNRRWTQFGVLALCVVWVPVAWAFSGGAMTAHTSSVGFDGNNLWSHAMHLGLLGFVAGSVFLLGKRGACRYFCPFGIVVDGCRSARVRARKKTNGASDLVQITPRRKSPTA